MPPEAENVIRRVCRKKKAPFFKVSKKDCKISPDKKKLDFSADGLEIKGLVPSLVGIHQFHNTALVLKAVAILRDYYSLNISRKAMVDGIRTTDWPGRFQIIKSNGCPALVLDVCHNRAGVAAFVASFRLKYPGYRAPVITGFVKRKEHKAMIDELAGITREFYLVPLKTKRSADLEELLRKMNWHDIPVKKYGSLKTAYSRVLKKAGPDDIICIIGSHYLVGEFLKNYIWK